MGATSQDTSPATSANAGEDRFSPCRGRRTCARCGACYVHCRCPAGTWKGELRVTLAKEGMIPRILRYHSSKTLIILLTIALSCTLVDPLVFPFEIRDSSFHQTYGNQISIPLL